MKLFRIPKPKANESLVAAAIIILVLLVLPQLGGIAMMVGSTLAFTFQVWLFPDRFRSRSGSLRPAVFLIVTLGLLTAVVVGLSIFKSH